MPINQSDPISRAVLSQNLGITPNPPQPLEVHDDMDETRIQIAQVNADGSITGEISEGVEFGSTATPDNSFLPTYDAAYMSPKNPAEAEPHDVVDVPGVGRMTVQSAIAAGFAIKTDNGLVQPGKQGPGGAPNTQQQRQHDGDADEKSKELLGQPEALANTTDEQLLNSVLADTSADSQVAAVKEVASTGDVSQGTLNELASQMQVEPEQVQGIIEENLRPAFERQARDAFTKATGIADGEGGSEVLDGMVDWLYANRPAEMNDAIQQQLLHRSTKGYAPLAKEALSNYDTVDPHGLLGFLHQNGEKGRIDEMTGRVVVTLSDGSEISWSSAILSGTITLT